MSLILAIESDHRQAGHLAQIVRRRLGAELIVAETFEAALPAIGNRVADLILVPALLSPEDDAALRFVLRVISHGSHVQVLTTPMFAGSHRESSSRRLLPGFLRTQTATSAGEGCDPEEFARHIASYLKTADEKRAPAQPLVMSPAGLEYDTAVAPRQTQPVAPPPEELAWEEPLAQPLTPIEAVEEVAVVADEEVAVVADNDRLDRLVLDLDLLLAAAQLAPADAPARPAPPLIERDDVAPVPTRVESLSAPSAGEDEWGLFDPKQCGIDALRVKLKRLP